MSGSLDAPMGTDALDLILGDADPGRRGKARRVTTAMRLLMASTREARSPSAAVCSGSALDELQSHSREVLSRRLGDLASHLASACLPQDTFFSLPVPEHSYTATWEIVLRALGEGGRAQLGLEIPLAVVGGTGGGPSGLLRVLDAHGRHALAEPGGLDELRHLLWRARVSWILEGDHGAFHESLNRVAIRAHSLGGGGARMLMDEILGDTIALHLDTAALGPAMELARSLSWIDEGTPRDGSQPLSGCLSEPSGRSTAYGAMACWLSGITDNIPKLDAEAGPFRGGLPSRWLGILDRVASAEQPVRRRPMATGQASTGGPLDAKTQLTGVTRRDLGARAMVVRLFDGARGLRVVEADVAPALKGTLDGWARSRAYAASESGSPEHAAVEAGTDVAAVAPAAVTTGSPGERLRLGFGMGAGGGRSAAGNGRGVAAPMAVLCAPLVDRSGNIVGLLWLEFDHRLIPSKSSLARATKWAEDKVLDTGWSKGKPAPQGGRDRSSQDEMGFGPLRAAWSSLMGRVLPKTQERKWAAFHWRPARPHSARAEDGAESPAVLVETGGDGALGEWVGGATRVLKRSMTTAAAIRYVRSEPGTMSFADSVQGASIPLLSGGVVIGVLLVESSRRGDLGQDLMERWSGELSCGAPELELAYANGMDCPEGGLALDVAAPDGEAWLGRLRSLSRTTCDVLVCGDLGSGRRTAARAIHHGAGWTRSCGPLRTIEALGLSVAALREELRRDVRGVILLNGIESLDPAAQAVLAEWVGKPSQERARLIATASGAGLAGQGSGLPAPAQYRGGGRSLGGTEDPTLGHLPGEDESGTGALGSLGIPPTSGRASAALSSASISTAAMSSAPLGAELGLEHRQLAASLMRAVLFVEPLRCRRHWIPPLVEAVLRRIARRESLDVPKVEDQALALLWRQSWPGNGLDLEALLYRAFLGEARERPGDLTQQDLALAFGSLGLRITTRLASRDPSRHDLASALWTTRTGSGRINKTRAALYLGWDPATVSARSKEAGLDTLAAVKTALRLGERRGV